VSEGQLRAVSRPGRKKRTNKLFVPRFMRDVLPTTTLDVLVIVVVAMLVISSLSSSSSVVVAEYTGEDGSSATVAVRTVTLSNRTIETAVRAGGRDRG
jgi:hypothetical protein